MIGLIIKTMRINANLSQKKLGELVSLADTTISSYERGNSQPDFDIIIKIAGICGYEFKIKTKTGKLFSVAEMTIDSEI